jgi:hypothetical protein
MATLALLVWGYRGFGEELTWRSAAPRATPATVPGAEVRQAFEITLGQPEPLHPVSATGAEAAGYAPLAAEPVSLFVRAQSAEAVPPPPPPPPPPVVGGPIAAPRPGEEAFNCGVANTPNAGGGFWSKFCDKCKGAWSDVTGSVKNGGSGARFQSDHKFDVFASPVSNPFYFEDPRALTEIRPLFMWQHTPSSNPIFNGGNNFFLGARGSVAFTDCLSLTVDELGLVFMHPNSGVGDIQPHNGFAEIHLGPKVTFLRNDTTGTVAAAGLIFELPVGTGSAFQDTRNLGLTPYFSIAQNFWHTNFGSLNFMNTDGYSFGIGSPRGDFFYASFHLDYDVGNLKKIYPLIELNWVYYAANGEREPINFEGRDLFHFGSETVHGLNELTMALGARYKFSEALQLGLVGEFNLLGGSRHLDAFRLTLDVIFRY